jgi:hypothetical protein
MCGRETRHEVTEEDEKAGRQVWPRAPAEKGRWVPVALGGMVAHAQDGGQVTLPPRSVVHSAW